MLSRLSQGYSGGGGSTPSGNLGGGGGLASLLVHVSHAVASAGGPSPVGGMSVASAAKATLARPGLTIYDKSNELNRLLRPSLAAYAEAASAHGATNGSSGVSHSPSSAQLQQPAITLKDLNEIFILIVGDVFGSQAVAAARYGAGWTLTSLSRSRHARDYYAALGFLGSSGTLARIAELLGEANLVLDYPSGRLPWAKSAAAASTDSFLRHEPYLPSSPLAVARSEFVQVTPFEYYLYHFASLVNVGAEWYGGAGGSVVDSDSLYPVLFEDYLSAHLPSGGENFKRQQHLAIMGGFPHSSPRTSSNEHRQSASPKGSRPSLLRESFAPSPVAANATLFQQETSPHFGRHLSRHHPETWRAHALVEVVTQFWLASWNEETPTAPDGTTMAKIPAGDVVKMVRMFIK